MTHLQESPMAAQARVVGPLLRKIRGLPDDLRVTADKLPIGCVVKAAGEWCGVVGFDGDRLELVRHDSAANWFYDVGDGELFMYDDGAF